MATWTTIPDSSLQPDSPARSFDALALRDNPIAIAEGQSGAPRIVNAAVTNGTLGAEKFKTGQDEVDWVLARTAAAAAGAVGTYALLISNIGVTNTYEPGDTESGASLRYSDVSNNSFGLAPSGTWRCMSLSQDNTDSSQRTAGLWLRIS